MNQRDIARRLTIALFKLDGVQMSNKKKTTSESEHTLMYALDDGQPHSQREIADEWFIPRTTLNTIVKQWEREELLTQTAIPGKKREMQIALTEKGRSYVKESMQEFYRMEEIAIARTIEKYSDSFIEAIEYLGSTLQEVYRNEGEQT